MICNPQSSPAARRYNTRVLIAMLIYAILLLTAMAFFKHHHPQRAVAVLVAILPSLPIVALIAIVGLYLKEETDEFQRVLVAQTFLWGMGGTLAVTSLWGFLELFTQVPHLETYLTFALFWFFVALARLALWFRYRSTDE
jgi:hypothetical protein